MRYRHRRLALIAIGICALLSPAPAAATSTPAEITSAKNNGVTYLKTLQLENGSIPGFGGDWSLTAFAAAGTAAANVKKTVTSTDARTWYKGLVGATSWPEGASPPASEFEKAALIAYAAGIDPARVSKTQNLIASIASYWQTASPGYYGEPGVFNGTVFALLALADSKTRTGIQRVPQVLLEKSIAVVLANQHTDGGWTYAKAEGSEELLHSASEPDMTGAAMAALCTAGVAKTNTAIVNAKNYLKSLLVNASGAFTYTFGVNTDSNAWAVQGLNACGFESQGTDFTTAMSKTPIDFLISQKLASGAFRYEASGTTANEYSSQDAVRALAGGGFTATPPVPSGGLEQWVFESSFNTSPTVKGSLALIINNATATLKVCSVKLAPEATSTTLGKVLDTAVGGTTPASCVTSRTPTTGEGAITSINGLPSPAEARWKVSIDGAAEVEAKRNTAIHLGDTIYLKLT